MYSQAGRAMQANLFATQTLYSIAILDRPFIYDFLTNLDLENLLVLHFQGGLRTRFKTSASKKFLSLYHRHKSAIIQVYAEPFICECKFGWGFYASIRCVDNIKGNLRPNDARYTERSKLAFRHVVATSFVLRSWEMTISLFVNELAFDRCELCLLLLKLRLLWNSVHI